MPTARMGRYGVKVALLRCLIRLITLNNIGYKKLNGYAKLGALDICAKEKNTRYKMLFINYCIYIHAFGIVFFHGISQCCDWQKHKGRICVE